MVPLILTNPMNDVDRPKYYNIVNREEYLKIRIKNGTLTYSHGLAPCYLSEMCTPVSTVPYLSALRSAAPGDLVVPRTRLRLGNRAFCVAGPVAWNSLPLDILSAPIFRNMLKTHPFSRSYFTD